VYALRPVVCQPEAKHSCSNKKPFDVDKKYCAITKTQCEKSTRRLSNLEFRKKASGFGDSKHSNTILRRAVRACDGKEKKVAIQKGNFLKSVGHYLDSSGNAPKRVTASWPFAPTTRQ